MRSLFPYWYVFFICRVEGLSGGSNEIIRDLRLPISFIERFQSFDTPEKAMVISARDLIRFVYFNKDEDAVFIPQEVSDAELSPYV